MSDLIGLTNLETKRIKPHEQQYKFVNSKAKFRAFVGGIGSGKTLIGCCEVVTFALENAGSLNMVTAPTYPMLRDSTLRTFFEVCPRHLIKDYSRGKNEVKLFNGSEVLFRSCDDPERLRGPTLASVYIDEAALVSRMAWKILLGRLRQKGFEQKAWITSTPKGFNWIYDEFVKKKDRNNYDIIYCSSKNNPFLPSDFVESLVESYSGSFALQEIEGKFVAMEGLVYSNFSRQVHEIKELPVFKKYIAGVDWGYTNPMACIIFGVDGDDRMYAVEEFYQKGVMFDEFVKVCKGFKEKYGISSFYCDPSEPEHLSQFRREGLNAREGKNAVVVGINAVASRLDVKKDGKARLFIHERCINTLMEFENYRYPEGREEKAVTEAPIKMFDHALDCVRYTCMSLEGGFKIAYLEDKEGILI